MKKAKTVTVSVAACAMQDHLIRQVSAALGVVPPAPQRSRHAVSTVEGVQHGASLQPQKEPPSFFGRCGVLPELLLHPAAAADSCCCTFDQGLRSGQSPPGADACAEVGHSRALRPPPSHARHRLGLVEAPPPLLTLEVLPAPSPHLRLFASFYCRAAMGGGGAKGARAQRQRASVSHMQRAVQTRRPSAPSRAKVMRSALTSRR